MNETPRTRVVKDHQLVWTFVCVVPLLCKTEDVASFETKHELAREIVKTRVVVSSWWVSAHVVASLSRAEHYRSSINLLPTELVDHGWIALPTFHIYFGAIELPDLVRANEWLLLHPRPHSMDLGEKREFTRHYPPRYTDQYCHRHGKWKDCPAEETYSS